MTRRTRVALAAMLVGMAAETSSFSQPTQFEGVWESQTNPGLVWTITQTQATVSLATRMRDRDIKTIEWAVDGATTTVPNAMGTFSAETKATVEDGALVFAGRIATKDEGQWALFEETWKLKGADQLSVRTQIDYPSSTFSREQFFVRRK